MFKTNAVKAGAGFMPFVLPTSPRHETGRFTTAAAKVGAGFHPRITPQATAPRPGATMPAPRDAVRTTTRR